MANAWAGWVHGTRPPDPPFDLNYEVDIGSGTVPKAKYGIDRFAHPNVFATVDLEKPDLPFEESSVRSAISHHCLEHLTDIVPIMEDVYRILEPGGIFFICVPLFPSTAAVEEVDHKSYFMAYDTPDGSMHCSFDAFCVGGDGKLVSESFSVPYTNARFRRLHLEFTEAVAPSKRWGHEDRRELRVALEAVK